MSDIPPNKSYDRHQMYVASPLTRGDIRSVTAPLRQFWKGLDVGRFNILFFLDTLYSEVDTKFKLTVKSVEEMGAYLGLAKPSKSEIWIREDIYQNAQNGEIEAEKVIAHEFGHYCLHGSIQFPKVADETTPPECCAEWQADIFAEELLGVSNAQLDLFEVS